jgi:TorA maturation chaperone TorD
MTADAARSDEGPVALALSRAAIYRLLGEAPGRPGPGQGDRVAGLAEAAAAVLDASPALGQALTGLATAARAADPATLATEYTFLFDGQVRCAPWESAYGAAPQMAGKAALLADVAGFYAAFGLAPASLQPDVEDHIVAELEFMSALALKEAWWRAEDVAEALEITRRAEVAFLSDHLGRWAPSLAEALRATTTLPYYVAAANLLTLWVQAEVDALGAAPGAPLGRLPEDPVQREDTFTCPMAEASAPEEATWEPRP